MKRHVHGLCLFLVLAAGAAGCGVSRTSDRDVAFVGVTEAEQILVETPGVFGKRAAGAWVDPRTEREYRAGHIPGAIHLPVETARTQHGQLVGYGSVVVYGNDYNDPIPIAMSKMLIEFGYPNVRTLRGGVVAWTEAGNELER